MILNCNDFLKLLNIVLQFYLFESHDQRSHYGLEEQAELLQHRRQDRNLVAWERMLVSENADSPVCRCAGHDSAVLSSSSGEFD